MPSVVIPRSERPYTQPVGVTFAEPWWLALGLLAVPLGLLGLRWFSAMTRWRAWSAVVARALLLLALAAALARASMVRSSDNLAVVAVADISDSITRLASVDGQPAAPAIRDWVTAATEIRGSDDLFGLVVFDDGAIAVNTPRAASTTDVSLDYTISPEGTNIAEALRFARALYPPGAGRRMLLISDGNETSGDALGAARELAGEGIRVDVLPISYRVEREVMIEAVDVPPQAAEESIVTVRVVLSSTRRTTGTLELLYEGEPLDLLPESTRTGRRITLEPGRNVETVEVPLTASLNVHRFEPVFVPDNAADDRIASNNRAEAFTVTPGRGRVLIVDGVSDALASGQGRLLERTLAQASIDATTISPAEFPSDPLEFQTASLVVLQNVAKEEITLQSQELLADYVQDLAGGLVMIGGPDSFGAGGWNGSPIEPLLPVLLDLPEQLIIPSAAVVMVLDSSGSMSSPVLGGARSQQEVANEAAALAIQTLDQGDLVGVIEFDSNFDEVVPLQKAENPALLADRVRDISPSGGTNLYPALRHAGRLLDNVEANVKHVIVLSDGQSEGAPETGSQIAREMAERGITVSTIAVGDGADATTLASIAQSGEGAFYRVINPQTLPKVFLREIRVVRRPLMRESLFVPRRVSRTSPLLAGLPDALVQLRGLVLTQARTDPTVTLALETPEGEPILAHWFAGRGQVAAWTSDAHNEWSQDWLASPAYRALWTQLVRTIAKPGADRQNELSIDLVDEKLTMRVDALDPDGTPIDLLTIDGKVYSPSGRSIDVRLSQVGPGVYEGSIDAPEQGSYVVALSPRQGDRALPSILGGATRAVGPELRVESSNVGVLQAIADTTGGRLMTIDDPLDADLWNRDGIEPSRAAQPLAPILLAIAVAIMLLDVATRRIAWDRLVNRHAIEEMRLHARDAVKARADAAATTLGALRTSASARQSGSADSPQADARDGVRRAPTDPAKQAARREQVLRDLSGDAPKPASVKPEPKRASDDDGDEGVTGLLAAKKRARERMDRMQDERE